MNESPDRPANPYVGPRPFEEGEGARFFGRERELEELYHLLLARRLVLLHSPSGAGKSSLIQAKLIPRMRDESFLVYPTVKMRFPGEAPPGANRFVYATLFALEQARPETERLGPEALGGLGLSDYLAARPEPASEELFIFDQFEEVLSLDPAGREAKRAFFVQLGAALENPRRWALFALREDYLGALKPYLLPVPTRLAATYRLDLLDPEQAMEAMQGPARGGGGAFDDAAARKLADDLRRATVQRPEGGSETVLGTAIEPVQLQVVCYRLWERKLRDLERATATGAGPRAAPHITVADIEAAGSVDEALAAYYADSVVKAAQAGGTSEREVRDWVERELITAGDLRGQVLRQVERTAGLPNTAIQTLVDAHLLRAEERRGATWYELAHDRLVAPIRADNQAWRETHLTPLQRQAALWEAQGRPEGLLLRGEALRQAEATLDAAELNEDERAFLEACRKARAAEERERRQNRRNLGFAIVAGVGFVVAVLAAVVAWAQFGAALAARERAEQAASQARTAQAVAERRDKESSIQRVATQALLDSRTVVDRAALLSVEAYRRRVDNPELRETVLGSLYGVLSANSTLRTLLRVEGINVTSLAFSKDKKLLIAGDDEGVLYFWDLQQQKLVDDPVRSNDCNCGITSLALSPDGKTLAVGSRNRKVVLFSVDSRRQIDVPIALQGVVNSVAFHPSDNSLLAIGGADNEKAYLYLWRSGQSQLIPLSGHGQEVTSVAFSPDGSILVSGSADATVRLWDPQTAQPIGQPLVTPDRDHRVRVVSVSPDGQTLVSGQYRSIYLWDLATARTSESPVDPREPPLIGHQNWISALAFRDSRTLISVGRDSTMLVWNLDERRPILERTVHSAAIITLGLSSDGQQIATGGADSTIAVWNFDRSAWLAYRTFEGSIKGRALQLGVTEDQIAVALVRREYEGESVDYSIRRADQPPDDTTISATPALTTTISAAMSPDGRLIGLGFRDGSIRIWNAEGEETGPTIVMPEAADTDRSPWTLAFDLDGQRLAVGKQDGGILIWDLSRPERPAIDLPQGTDSNTGHTWRVISLAFSPDGKWLASGSWDNRILLWKLDGPPQAIEIINSNEDIQSLSFSPDSATLAAGGEQSVFLVDVARGTLRTAPLLSHRSDVISLAFSPDGRYLASGSTDQTVVLWEVAGGRRFGQPLRIVLFEGWVRGLTFLSSEDLLVANDFGFWHVDLRPENWERAACALANRNLSAEEWQQYFGDEQQRPTCDGTERND